jgi:hypothetical protein
MITNLNSWSFEPSSNKSVEHFDPSIPIPSGDQTATEPPSAVFARNSIRSALPGSSAFRQLSRFLTLHTPFADLSLRNPLIARGCTPLHVNEKNSQELAKSQNVSFFPARSAPSKRQKHIQCRVEQERGMFRIASFQCVRPFGLRGKKAANPCTRFSCPL